VGILQYWSHISQLFKVAPCWLVRGSAATQWFSFCQTAHDSKFWAGKKLMGDQVRENMVTVKNLRGLLIFVKRSIDVYAQPWDWTACLVLFFLYIHKYCADFDIDIRSFCYEKMSKAWIMNIYVINTYEFFTQHISYQS